MNTVLNIYKPVGVTPLEIIDNVKENYPEYKDQKIGYAGRLDPLAHGVLLLMVGEATKERERFLHLEKEYVFEVLFGVETDTYDLLGLLTSKKQNESIIVNEKVNAFVKSRLGKKKQSYPPYSSMTVNGKPLFWWARNGKLSEIMVPEREITIKEFTVLGFNEVSKKALEEKVLNDISLIKGDFRQQEISLDWQTFFESTKLESFQTAKFRVSCSSGTYVRGLAHEMGKKLGCGAVTLDILRTRVGDFWLEESLRF
jgi:tRNA pseudouridine55 synthase